MRVPVKLLGFGFWLFFLNCARCQECLRENIIYENTEPAEKLSYADGERVKVNCVTGYTGFYRLKCEKGEWKKTIERPCAKKQCSHPGDTPNGDFELEEGTEFVFGVTVVYKCNKGYKMASSINHRSCRAEGWDNAVPVCEMVKCPAIRTDEEVTASGNTTEDGSYGDVIRFECVSSDKMINGSSEIHCEETGKWSDVVPKCKDITCTAPPIPNGFVVDSQPEYKKDAPLKYKCSEMFKPREGIPRCAKFGWTVKPECDGVDCVLKSTTYGVKMIIPYGKIIFRSGESVDITCSEKHWLFGTKESKRTFTCQDNGVWDNEPVCAEITCDDPRDQLVSRPYYWRTMKLGEKQSYICVYGYRQTAAEATCTRDGWTPNPLCTEIVCAAPTITNAEIVGPQRSNYKINSRIQYKCRSGFEPEESVQITCDREGQWRDILQCTVVKCPPIRTDEEVTASGNTEEGSYGDVIRFECVSSDKMIDGNSEIHCEETGKWSDVVPKCKDITCTAPPIPNGFVVDSQPEYKKDAPLNYKCSETFKPREGIPRCAKFGWTVKPECDGVNCVLTSTTFGVKIIIPYGKIIFRSGESVEITCSEKHWLFGTKESKRTFTCQDNGVWDNEPVCAEITCEVPRDQHVYRPYFWRTMKLGEKRSYSCDYGYRQTAAEATCTRDGWTPNPLCTGQTTSCGPPPDVNDADTIELKKDEYTTGERVEYSCFFKYTLDLRPPFSSFLTCDQGEWRGNIKCLKPCTVTVEEMNRRGIELAYVNRQKMFAPHNDYISFACKRGKVSVGVPLRQQCNDGVMTLPECE